MASVNWDPSTGVKFFLLGLEKKLVLIVTCSLWGEFPLWNCKWCWGRGRSRGEIRTAEVSDSGKVIAQDVPKAGPGAAETVVRVILKEEPGLCVTSWTPCGCGHSPCPSILWRNKFDHYNVNNNPLFFITDESQQIEDQRARNKWLWCWLAKVNTLVRPSSEKFCIYLARLLLWIEPAVLESLKLWLNEGCRDEMIHFI